MSGFFKKGHVRSKRAKKNIAVSVLLKGASIIIGLMLVPLTLNYVGPDKYGIWITISAIISWFTFFDIGLGNGLRNKFAEALAQGNKELARVYVSTTYAILIPLILLVYILFILVSPLLDWTKLLNTSPEMGGELSKCVIIVFTFFSLSFVFKLISTLLNADQKTAISDSFVVIGHFLSLITVFILTKITTGSLILLGTCLGATPVVVLLIANFYFFSRDYKEYFPSLKYVDLGYIRDLAGVGVQFFLLQISVIIIFSTDNIIIAHLFGPKEVTPYNISYRYFSMSTMVSAIILAPFWSAFTEAYYRGDISWVRKSMKKLIKIWLLMFSCTIFMVLFANTFYRLWVGSKIEIPFVLSALMGLYVIIVTWNSIFAQFINGVGKIRLQVYYGVFGAIINIPLSVFMAKNLNLGSSGVILATCISLLGGTVLGPIQCKRIINNKAKGIWNL